MDTLMLNALEPRDAGGENIDANVSFTEIYSLHESFDCEYTCGCRRTTAVCIPTGSSAFE